MIVAYRFAKREGGTYEYRLALTAGEDDALTAIGEGDAARAIQAILEAGIRTLAKPNDKCRKDGCTETVAVRVTGSPDGYCWDHRDLAYERNAGAR